MADVQKALEAAGIDFVGTPNSGPGIPGAASRIIPKSSASFWTMVREDKARTIFLRHLPTETGERFGSTVCEGLAMQATETGRAL